MYQGKAVRVTALDDGLVELCFDRQGEAINKLDVLTLRELGEAIAAIGAAPGLRGVLISSAKGTFIVGADITEFSQLFALSVDDLTALTTRSNALFNAIEDWPVPSVAAINGFALGGGLETALAASLRVMATAAQVGLPEVTLGITPGYGGTVRLSRVAGAAVAIDWVTRGKPQRAEAALAAGTVDEIAAPEPLRDHALALLRRAAAGEIDWQARQARKRAPVGQGAALAELFGAAKARVAAGAPRHQPAALAAVEMLERAAPLERTGALNEETATFVRLTRTQAAAALTQTFLSDQVLKKLFKQHARAARPVRQGAVLGAGIMGGGIATTSALRGTPVRMKDIAQAPLDLGMAEARKQLARQVKAGRRTPAEAEAILASITPQLDDAGFDAVDVVIEAVVEKLEVKRAVLAELETKVRADTVIASNTSSLRIDDLAGVLARPQNFVGMHFFNPVPVMPLVEVVRGSASSDAAVATAVGYALAMGKTPIVVKDCPGFLVNRILAAYMRGFLLLVEDGADFARIDQVMEVFGWPMGPAYLEDVVGIDTGSHVADVIAAGYPARMPFIERDALRLMAGHQRYGQKNGIGFYQYTPDPNGRPKRSPAPDTPALLAQIQPNGQRDFSDAEIIDRMMIGMIVEAACALEQGIVASPAELDMALQLGLGLPAYLGGALKYADWLGLAEVVARAERLSARDPVYAPTARLRAMAAAGQRFYG